jgi:predicted HicB family RNase H-like nuclease
MAKTVRVYLSNEAHAQAKAAAALQGVTLAAWIEAAIMEKLERPAPKKKGKRNG